LNIAYAVKLLYAGIMLTPLRDATARLLPGIVTTAAVVGLDQQIGTALTTYAGPEVGRWWQQHGISTTLIILSLWIALEIGILLWEGHRYVRSTWTQSKAWLEGEWVYFSHYYTAAKVCADLDAFNRKTLPDTYETAALSPARLEQIASLDTRYIQRIGVVHRTVLFKWRKLQGYYVAAGLSKSGRQRILSGSVLNGHCITDDMLVSSWDEADSMYIFGIYAKNSRTATARTISALASFVHEQFSRYPLSYCFTRGGTVRGQMQMSRYTFKAIDESEIKYIDREEIEHRWDMYRTVFERHCVTKVDEDEDVFDDE